MWINAEREEEQEREAGGSRRVRVAWKNGGKEGKEQAVEVAQDCGDRYRWRWAARAKEVFFFHENDCTLKLQMPSAV